MKKLAVALLFGALALPVNANNSNQMSNSALIDGNAETINIFGAAYRQGIYFNDKFSNIPFQEVLYASKIYQENGDSENLIRNWSRAGLVKAITPFEEKRNPTYYSELDVDLKFLLQDFVYANFFAGEPAKNTGYIADVNLSYYDMDKEILSLGQEDDDSFRPCQHLASVAGRKEVLRASNFIKLDIKGCPYVHMPIDVAEKLWGSNPNERYLYVLQGIGKGNGIEESCKISPYVGICLKMKPEQIKVTLFNEKNEEVWSSDKVSFTIDD